MGLWDKITGKETKKSATKKSVKKETTKKDLVLKGPDKKKAEPKTKIKITGKTWTKGKLDKLSKAELHAVAKEHGVKTDGLTKTQIQSLIVKG